MKRFLAVEYHTLHQNTFLPEVFPGALFILRGECLLSGIHRSGSVLFSGLHEKVRPQKFQRGFEAIVVTFEPVGAAAFLRPSLEEFAGAVTDLAGVVCHRDELNRLFDHFSVSHTQERRIALIEDFLLARLRNSRPDLLVAAGVNLIRDDPGAARIDGIARQVGLSQSALERRFRQSIGITPKRLASVMRFRRTVRLMAGGMDPASVAHTAGYFDQSHFIDDFRSFTGRSPVAYFAENRVFDLSPKAPNSADPESEQYAMWRSESKRANPR